MTTRPTDSRLLEVAIEHFGRFGLNAASTRAIAKDAGTPMSSITYHFGGKEGLYLAAARHIGAQMAERLAPAVTVAERVETDDPLAARQALLTICAHVASVLASSDTAPLARFIVREQADPTEAFGMIYDGMMAPLLALTARLIGIVAGGRLGEGETRLRAVALMGQLLVFRVARETALRAAGWTDIGPAELETIQRITADHLEATLDRLAERGRR